MPTGEDMSQSRKYLYWVNVIYLALAVIWLIFGVDTILRGANGALTESPDIMEGIADQGEQSAAYLRFYAIFITLFSAWKAFVGWLGIKAARNPKLMLRVTIVHGLTAAVVAASAVYAFVGGGLHWSDTQDLLPILSFYFCIKILKGSRGSKE